MKNRNYPIDFHETNAVSYTHLDVYKRQFYQLGDSKIELLEATNPESPIAKFIEKKGEGIHHIAFGVEDIRAEVERLKAEGFIFISEEPKDGADNKLVVFLHPCLLYTSGFAHASSSLVVADVFYHLAVVGQTPGSAEGHFTAQFGDVADAGDNGGNGGNQRLPCIGSFRRSLGKRFAMQGLSLIHI